MTNWYFHIIWEPWSHLQAHWNHPTFPDFTSTEPTKRSTSLAFSASSSSLSILGDALELCVYAVIDSYIIIYLFIHELSTSHHVTIQQCSLSQSTFLNYQKVHPRSSVVLCQLGTPGSSSYASSSSSILRNGGIVDKLQRCHDFGGCSLYHLRVEPFSRRFYISTLQSLGK